MPIHPNIVLQAEKKSRAVPFKNSPEAVPSCYQERLTETINTNKSVHCSPKTQEKALPNEFADPFAQTIIKVNHFKNAEGAIELTQQPVHVNQLKKSIIYKTPPKNKVEVSNFSNMKKYNRLPSFVKSYQKHTNISKSSTKKEKT